MRADRPSCTGSASKRVVTLMSLVSCVGRRRDESKKKEKKTGGKKKAETLLQAMHVKEGGKARLGAPLRVFLL